MITFQETDNCLKTDVGAGFKNWWELFEKKNDGNCSKKKWWELFKKMWWKLWRLRLIALLWGLFLITGDCTSKFNAIELIQLMQITDLIKSHFNCHVSDIKYAWMNFRTIILKLICFSWNSLMRSFSICNRLLFITTTLFAAEEEELSPVPLTFQKWSSRLCLSSSVFVFA